MKENTQKTHDVFIPLVMIFGIALSVGLIYRICWYGSTGTESYVCGNLNGMYFEQGLVCFSDRDDHDFTRTERNNIYVYENPTLYEDNIARVSYLSKEEYAALPTYSDSSTISSAAMFSYQESGIEKIDNLLYIKLAHGYFPIDSTVPTNFVFDGATITGYSYAAVRDDGSVILFDSGAETDAKEWISGLVSRIE